MAEYHVACGVAGINAGILNKKGDQWRNKNDVTNEALAAVAQRLFFDKKEYRFNYNEKRYVMKVTEMEEN